MVKMFKQNKNLYLTVMISLALISVSIITSNIFSIVAFVLIAVAILLFEPCDSYVVLFALMPFANIFKLTPNSTSLFTILEIMAVLLGLFREKRMRSSVLISLLVLPIYMVVFSINNLQVLTIIKVITGFVLIYCVTTCIKKEDILNIAYLMSTSVAVMLLLCQIPAYFKFVTPYLNDLDYFVDGTGLMSDIFRNSGFLGDPNYCAVLIVVVVSLLCVLYFYKHIGVEFWIFCAILVPLGFLTYSKSYFLCIIMLAVVLIVFVLLPKHRGWAITSLVGIGVLIGFALSGKIEVFNMILLRFGDGSDITTGRTALNAEYLSYITDNLKVLLFGEGISADRFIGANNNVHNIYIELLFKMGIIGSMIYIISLFSVFNRYTTISSQKRKIINYIPALFVIVMFGFLAGTLYYAVPFYLIIAYCACNYNLIPSLKL